jgi:hypothetical protein
VARGRFAFGHELGGIFVAQRIEVEIATLRDARGLADEIGRIDPRKLEPRAQMPLGVGMECFTRGCDGNAETDRGEHVLQGSSRAHMHVDVAGGDEWEPARLCELTQGGKPSGIVQTAYELGGDPRAAGKALRHEPRVFEIGAGPRNEQDKTAGQAMIEIANVETVFPLDRAHARFRDERAHRAVTRTTDCEQHEPGPVFKRGLGADDQLQARFFAAFYFFGFVAALDCDVRPHDACDRALVRDRERAVAERVHALDELLRVRRAAQEREVGETVKLGVVGQHRIFRQKSRAETSARSRCARDRSKAALPMGWTRRNNPA